MRIPDFSSLPLTLSGAAGSALSASGDSFSFGAGLGKAIDLLDRSQKNAEQEIASAVTGESPDLHRTVIALQSADLGLQLALQVRNKLMNAYEEIMRMQV
jgi:flagellar hook-basal body complex protein FliE